MFLFQDGREQHDTTYSKNLDGFKDIKSTESTSMEKVKDYWNKTFRKADTYIPDDNENYFSEVFGCTGDEFHFDFDIGQNLRKDLESFNGGSWNNMSENEKAKNICEFSAALSEKLGLMNPPTIAFFNGQKDSCGSYNSDTNVITINRALFNDSAEVVDTIAHETRHAYQHQRANAMETKQDYLYKFNFDNYLSPVSIGSGKYLFFTDYQDQLVESEARAFANIFREKETV